MQRPTFAAGGGNLPFGLDPISKKGFLTDIGEIRLRGGVFKKLTISEVVSIATALGHLSRRWNLYDLLFKDSNSEHTLGGVTWNTKDLAMFVFLDHRYTRGYLMKHPSKVTSDTTMCQGVPLALEGAKRLYNKSYMSWLDGIDLEDRESMFELDIFLPKDLGSLDIDDYSGDVKPNKFYGLLNFVKNNIVIPTKYIERIKDQLIDWRGTYSPNKVDAEGQEEAMYFNIYNNCGPKLRCMLLQSWAWSPICRNPSMITDPLDWDNYPKTTQFEGLIPKGQLPKGLKNLLQG